MSEARRGGGGRGQERGPGGQHVDRPSAGGGQGHTHGGHHEGHGHAGHDRLGNPQDLAAYLARLEGEDRVAWQKPDEVIRLLGVKRGDRVCDVGVGPGYFALRLARAVGPQGEVYAFDAEPRMLEVLRQRMREQGLLHVRPVLAEEGVPPRP
ncbi:MAG TPA: methyltransferase domain-containing protein, partial [Anaeromyxobacteraceae bacterium]